MRTIILDKKKYRTALPEIAAALRAGKIIAYPTETLYGLGCDAANARAAAKIFQIKGRASAKALPVLVSSPAMAQKYFCFTPLAKKLAKKYWPGPLTIVVDYNAQGKRFFKKSINQNSFDAGVRFSGNAFATALVRKLGAPLVATSANASGKPAALSAPEVFNYFKKRKHQPDIIVDGGALKPSKGSTVVDARDCNLKILRQGDLEIRH